MEKKVLINFMNNGIHLKVTGVLDENDLLKIAHIDHNDERSVEAKYLIADFLDATAEHILPKHIDRVLAIDLGASRWNPNMKLALLAKHESTVSCLTYYIEFAQKMKIPWNLRLFDKIEEAKAWCEV
jgi:hypothetical protein